MVLLLLAHKTLILFLSCVSIAAVTTQISPLGGSIEFVLFYSKIAQYHYQYSYQYYLLVSIRPPLTGSITGISWKLFPESKVPFNASSGKLGGQDSFESIESFESCDRLTQSWSSQSSFSSLQRVPSYDSFDSEDYPTALHGHKPKGTFKDYVRERSDLSKDKPVIPAAALAGYTGESDGVDATRLRCLLVCFFSTSQKQLLRFKRQKKDQLK